MKIRSVRMTDAEWEDCKRYGGGAWIREQIGLQRYKEALLGAMEVKFPDEPFVCTNGKIEA